MACGLRACECAHVWRGAQGRFGLLLVGGRLGVVAPPLRARVAGCSWNAEAHQPSGLLAPPAGRKGTPGGRSALERCVQLLDDCLAAVEVAEARPGRSEKMTSWQLRAELGRVGGPEGVPCLVLSVGVGGGGGLGKAVRMLHE